MVQKHQNHVVNLFAVDVLRVALQDANVSRLPLNALSCVPVLGNVQLIHDHYLLLNTAINYNSLVHENRHNYF